MDVRYPDQVRTALLDFILSDIQELKRILFLRRAIRR
jgi:hypothetical protein